MSHATDACDEALLPRARAATRDWSIVSGWSFASVASATLALGGIASLALAVLSGTSSLASLGVVRDGDPAVRVPSAHRGGAKPPVFVVSSVNPGDDAAFEAFKRDVLLDALRAPPDFVARASWAGASSATRLPEKIERYEEACEVFEHGLATLTGTYVGQTHAWSDPRASPFFELDDGKKMTVTRRAVASAKALAPAFRETIGGDRASARAGASSSSSTEEEEGEEISEPEKKAVGDAVGGAVSHLLAWRRARSAAADPNANANKKLSTPGGGALVMDVGLFRLADDPLVGASWSSALDAVTAYRPRDADVVFLDVDADALGDKSAPTQTLKMGGDVREVSFHRHDGSVGDGGASSSDHSHTTPLNPAMYFVTDAFLTKAFHEIDKEGFGFVAEFLREKCAANVFNCYATTPRFAARGNSKADERDSRDV